MWSRVTWGLLCQAKSDFETIDDTYRGHAFFAQALGLRGVPWAARLRERLDELAGSEGGVGGIGGGRRAAARPGKTDANRFKQQNRHGQACWRWHVRIRP